MSGVKKGVDSGGLQFKQVFAVGGSFSAKIVENSLEWPWIGVKSPPDRKNLLKTDTAGVNNFIPLHKKPQNRRQLDAEFEQQGSIADRFVSGV